MNKEMIERIALEVAQEVTPEFVWEEGCNHENGVCKYELYEFAQSFLARIDAEQSAEIERLKDEAEVHSYWRLFETSQTTIAQQAERIAEQAALIEKCEKAISIAAHSRIAVLRNGDPSHEGYPYRTDDEVAKIDGYTASLIEALSAISAHKS